MNVIVSLSWIKVTDYLFWEDKYIVIDHENPYASVRMRHTVEAETLNHLENIPVIMVPLQYLAKFIKEQKNTDKRIDHPYILFTIGVGYYDDRAKNIIEDLLMIKGWIGTDMNLNVKKSRFPIIPLPLGLRIRTSYDVSLYNPGRNLLNADRNNLAAFNFSTKSRPNIRAPLKKMLTDNGFQHRQTSNHQEYLDHLANSKFCFSPPGHGVDCWRHWECFYQGCIPIMTALPFSYYWEDKLPILIVEDWSEITPEFLEDIYPKIIARNYQWQYLDFTYYQKKIKELKDNLSKA